jgi:hypothetical protein
LTNGKNEVVFFSRSPVASLTMPVVDLFPVERGAYRYYGPALVLCIDIFHPPRA